MIGELSMAPMSNASTPSFRSLIRTLSKTVLLFTEMIPVELINRGSDEKILILLGAPENKTVVQVAGSNPNNVVKAVKRLVSMGYKDFNLNCGSPPRKEVKEPFGAAIMKRKEVIVDVVNAVYKETQKILSIKCRVGVDLNDSYEFFESFVLYIANNTPCKKFYIHCRKCWLDGVNEEENRPTPGLNYQYPYELKKNHPDLTIILNGGVNEDNAEKVVKNLDGVMIARGALNDVLVFNKILNEPFDLRNSICEYIGIALKFNYDRRSIDDALEILLKNSPSNLENFKLFLNDVIFDDKNTISEINEKIKEFVTNCQTLEWSFYNNL